MRANRFVNILNGDRVAFEFTRRDGPAIQNETGNIQARQRHNAGGNGFVAANENDKRIEQIAARHQFNRIGDDFAAHQ